MLDLEIKHFSNDLVRTSQLLNKMTFRFLLLFLIFISMPSLCFANLHKIRVDDIASLYLEKSARYGNTSKIKETEALFNLLAHEYKSNEPIKFTSNVNQLVYQSRIRFFYAAFGVDLYLKKNRKDLAKSLTVRLLPNTQILTHSEKIAFYCKTTRNFFSVDDNFVIFLGDWIQTRMNYLTLNNYQKFNIYFLLSSVFQVKKQVHMADYYLNMAYELIENCSLEERIMLNSMLSYNFASLSNFDKVAYYNDINTAIIPDKLKYSFANAQHLLMKCIQFLDGPEIKVDSLRYFSEDVLDVAQKIENPLVVNRAYRFLAFSHLYAGEIDQGLRVLQESISILEDRLKHNGFFDSVIIAKIYLHTEQFEDFKSISANMKSYLEKDESQIDPNIYLKICELFVDFYIGQNDYKSAMIYKNFETNQLLKNIRNSFKLKAIELNALTQETNKKLAISGLENLNKTLENQAIKSENNTIILLVVALFVLVIAIVLFVLFKKISKQNNVLTMQTNFIHEQYKALEENKILLEQALNEKGVLLNELHHRVKNNLQFISSSLILQAQESENVTIQEFADIIDSRIGVLALSFKKLDVNESNVEVNLSDFLTELCHEAKMLHQNSFDNLSIHVKIDSLVMNMSDSIYLGMIVNESITNAFKHGFTKHITNPTLEINLFRTNNLHVLEIKNNGESIQSTTKHNQGMTIMNALASKLRGTLEVCNIAPRGTLVKLEFKHG